MNLARTFLLTIIFTTCGFIACSQTLQTLVSFANTNGTIPTGLTLGNDGNFYGMTKIGGGNGNGTAFRVTTNGILTMLVNFNYAVTGADPTGLTLGKDGNFYGTTSEGGGSNFGTIFQMTPN